jgi:hypothetical protein
MLFGELMYGHEYYVRRFHTPDGLSIILDTITNRKGFYNVGYWSGETLLMRGAPRLSKWFKI